MCNCGKPKKSTSAKHKQYAGADSSDQNKKNKTTDNSLSKYQNSKIYR